MSDHMHLMPADNLKVRSEDGSRHISELGEFLPDSNYYRRAFLRGDLVLSNDEMILERASSESMQSVHPDWFTKDGSLTLDQAEFLTGRRFSRKELENIIGE